jgi:hypothetical protein
VVFGVAGFCSAVSPVELWRAAAAETHANIANVPTAMNRAPRI